mmetsp:Transcript_155/g.1190  ORF Transcript_155/g.1190 Transcript_155/m.1190 type:complete len:258 (-) Transcript_155:1397-2170(-)
MRCVPDDTRENERSDGSEGATAAERNEKLTRGSNAMTHLSDETQVLPRRAALSLVAGIAAVAGRVAPSQAAYGESANVFGRISNESGFLPYAGDGYSLLIPSKWNPSKERAFPGVDLCYEDNFDAVSNLNIVVNKTSKSSIKDFGSPEQAFKEVAASLLGEQTFSGKTVSEGGFAPDRVSAASILDVGSKSVNGKEYYLWDVLTRTADGDEGGRHQLFSATVSNGKLYVLKVQSGDKRWFKGQEGQVRKVRDTFTVA